MITKASNNKTTLAIVLSAILKEPFACLYILLPFFLLKDLEATAFQIVILTTLRPLVSIFSFYISEFITMKGMTLRSAVLWTGLLARIAFIPALFTENIWLYIFGSTLYMIFTRAEIPALMEVIKTNVERNKWERAFSAGSMISYTSGVFVTILFHNLIDARDWGWRLIFTLSLIFSVGAVIIQSLLIVNDKKTPQLSGGGMIKPIKDVFILLKENHEFRKFQWAFMLGGVGLMIIQPVIPIYFSNTLSIKYSDLLIAFCVCKALGFVLTTPIWNKLLEKLPFNMFIFSILIGFSLFSFLLIFSAVSMQCIFLAYVLYGIAGAGSHLIWHLSGPMFSKQDASNRYTAVNVVMVGVRGLVGPFLGWCLLFIMDPIWIFAFSMFLCLTGGLYYYQQNESQAVVIK